MSLHCIWTPLAASSAHLPLTGVGYSRFGSGCPDLHLLASGGSVGLLLSNGAVDPKDSEKQLGTLSGRFQVLLGGSLVIDEDVTIPDGTAIAYSQPGPAFSIKKPIVEWLLRDCAKPSGDLAAALLKFFGSLNPYFGGTPGYDLPEPDQAGSPRLTEYMCAGATGAAFLANAGVQPSPAYRAAAFDWARLQYRRPTIYYNQDTGEPYRWSSEPDTWVDEKGLRKSGKATVERPSLCTYQAADPEHLTVDREWAAALLYNDPLAWRLLEHQGEAICSLPMCRESVIHGNLRAYGRVLKALALLAGAWGAKRPQLIVAFQRCLTALLASFKDGEWPSLNPQPKGGLMPVAFTHVGMVQADLDQHPDMTFDQVAEAMRGVIVPWVGTVLTACEVALTVPALGGFKDMLLVLNEDARACLMGPGRDVVGIDNDGGSAFPAPVLDSYAAGMPHRVHRPNLSWNGTVSEWTACAFAALAKEGNPAAQSAVTAMKANCSDLQGITLQGVEAYWPLLAL